MDIWQALADPTRRRMVELLGERERSAGELVAEFSMSAPAISQHIRILQRCGLVQARVDRQRRIQVLVPEALGEIEAWIGRYRKGIDRLAPSLPVKREVVEESVPVQEESSGQQGLLF